MKYNLKKVRNTDDLNERKKRWVESGLNNEISDGETREIQHVPHKVIYELHLILLNVYLLDFDS